MFSLEIMLNHLTLLMWFACETVPIVAAIHSFCRIRGVPKVQPAEDTQTMTHANPTISLVVGIPVIRYGRAARPCALNFRLAALKCRFGHPPNALSSVRVWPSMPPLCASFIQNVITLTRHLFIGKNVAYPNTVTCLLISNCSGKQTD